MFGRFVDIDIINMDRFRLLISKFISKNKNKIIIFDMTIHRISVHYGFYDTAENH